MQAAQEEIHGIDPEIRRIMKWAGSTVPGARRILPEKADVRHGSEGSLAGQVLGAALFAALFFASSRLLDALPF
jgi:hypothetical protein